MSEAFANPYLLEQYFSGRPDPRVGLNPAANGGLDALQPGTVDRAVQGQEPQTSSRFTMPGLRTPAQAKPKPKAAYNSATKQIAVGSNVFDFNDDRQIVDSAARLESDAALGDTPTTPGWDEVDPTLIQRKAQQIRDAGFFTRLGKGVEGGWEESKMLGGAALETLGTAVGSEGIKSYGRETLTNAVDELEKLDPYSGEFLDIDGPGGALDWVAYTIGQFGIGILQTAVVAVGTGGAGLGAMALKAGAGKLLKKAATKRVNKEALNPDETKALKDAAEVLAAARFKTLAKAGGAAEIGTMSVGEAAAEQISRNGEVDPLSALLTGAAAGVLDALPIMSALKRFRTPRGEQGLGRRVGGAAIAGGLWEGGTEAAQDAIYAFGAGGLEALRDKPIAEYINAAAAGALGGSVLSASVAALQRGEKLDTNTPVAIVPPKQLDLFPGDPLRRGVRSDVPGGQGELFNDVTAPVPNEEDVVPEPDDRRRFLVWRGAPKGQLDLFDTPEPTAEPTAPKGQLDLFDTPEPTDGPVDVVPSEGTGAGITRAPWATPVEEQPTAGPTPVEEQPTAGPTPVEEQPTAEPTPGNSADAIYADKVKNKKERDSAAKAAEATVDGENFFQSGVNPDERASIDLGYSVDSEDPNNTSLETTPRLVAKQAVGWLMSVRHALYTKLKTC